MIKAYLNYQEVLSRVELFMKTSGIRDFCTNHCRGQCCLGCAEINDKSCARIGARRLSCSIQLCLWYRKLFTDIIGFEHYEGLRERMIKFFTTFSLENYAQLGGFPNVFFDPPRPELIAEFFWPACEVDRALAPELARQIQRRLTILSIPPNFNPWERKHEHTAVD